MQAKLVSRASLRLNFNTEYTADTELLNGYFEEALGILTYWRKLRNHNEFLSGEHDVRITNFIIQSFNYTGMEGQDYYSNHGRSRNFKMTPEARLKASIPQMP